jgi:4a-hydroxytetrahydrobiopterin dehydratase
VHRRRLSESELAEALRSVPGWTHEGGTLRRAFAFPSFAEGIRFVGRVAVEADAIDHHPDIDIRYATVSLVLTTHSAGGLTALDITLASRIDALAG